LAVAPGAIADAEPAVLDAAAVQGHVALRRHHDLEMLQRLVVERWQGLGAEVRVRGERSEAELALDARVVDGGDPGEIERDRLAVERPSVQRLDDLDVRAAGVEAQ